MIIKHQNKYYTVEKEFDKQARLNEIKLELDRLKDWQKNQKDRIDSLYQRKVEQLTGEQKELNLL
ncbi:hypothetical protein M0R04_10700 [Candidatus Dojkabacteria bacterium]|jgi:hypothetical protein|nr:hypothetical protein [Candidatus Dojkabacteria bacterium]